MRRAAAIGALAGALLVVVLIARSDGGGRELRAAFPSAVNMVKGAEVRAGGVKVGTVRGIELRGERAELRLGIDDDAVWPLHAGTHAQIRLGGNVSYANRYVELVPGSGTGRPLGDGARLPARDATSPLEFDELFNTFDTRTRAGMGALVDRGAATFGPRGGALREGLPVAGRALHEGGAFLSEVSADPARLRTLLRTTAGTADALARRDGDLRELVGATAQTLTAVAAGGRDVRATVRELPGALRAARTTLARTSRSLVGVDALVADIAPGARRLRTLAPPLRDALTTLRAVAPELNATLRTLRRGGPGIASFLRAASAQVTRLRPALERLEPMTACLRAYSPEIAGFLSTWASFPTMRDSIGRIAQLNGQALPIPNGTPLNSAATMALFPQLRYGLARPPGFGVDQPWLRPECGAGAAGIDATKDPEARG